MHPHIDKVVFGWIQIDGRKYKHDVVIECDGTIRKRKKKLSKAEFGTSHIISLAEAMNIYTQDSDTILIGSGMFDSVRLSEQAEDYFNKKQINVIILPTGKALKHWNKSESGIIGLFHVTC